MFEELVIPVSRFIMQAYLKVVEMFSSFRQAPILINKNILIRAFIHNYQIRGNWKNTGTNVIKLS